MSKGKLFFFVVMLFGVGYFSWNYWKEKNPPPPPVVVEPPAPVIVPEPEPVVEVLPKIEESPEDEPRSQEIQKILENYRAKEGFDLQKVFPHFKNDWTRRDLYVIKKFKLMSPQQIRKLEIMYEKEILFSFLLEKKKIDFAEGLSRVFELSAPPYLESDVMKFFILTRKIHEHDMGLLLELTLEDEKIKTLLESLFDVENYKLVSLLDNYYYGRLNLTYHEDGVKEFKEKLQGENATTIPEPILRVLKFDNLEDVWSEIGTPAVGVESL